MKGVAMYCLATVVVILVGTAIAGALYAIDQLVRAVVYLVQ